MLIDEFRPPIIEKRMYYPDITKFHGNPFLLCIKCAHSGCEQRFGQV